MDVLEFDAASNTQVDKIREMVFENINIAPSRDRYKVFIIDEVHMLSTSSFNALLKTLEEPPEASPDRGPAFSGEVPRHAKTRRDVVEVLLHE